MAKKKKKRNAFLDNILSTGGPEGVGRKAKRARESAMEKQKKRKNHFKND